MHCPRKDHSLSLNRLPLLCCLLRMERRNGKSGTGQWTTDTHTEEIGQKSPQNRKVAITPPLIVPLFTCSLALEKGGCSFFSKMNHFSLLSREMIASVLSHVSFRDRHNVALTCKLFFLVLSSFQSKDCNISTVTLYFALKVCTYAIKIKKTSWCSDGSRCEKTLYLVAGGCFASHGKIFALCHG